MILPPEITCNGSFAVTVPTVSAPVSSALPSTTCLKPSLAKAVPDKTVLPDAGVAVVPISKLFPLLFVSTVSIPVPCTVLSGNVKLSACNVISTVLPFKADPVFVTRLPAVIAAPVEDTVLSAAIVKAPAASAVSLPPTVSASATVMPPLTVVRDTSPVVVSTPVLNPSASLNVNAPVLPCSVVTALFALSSVTGLPEASTSRTSALTEPLVPSVIAEPAFRVMFFALAPAPAVSAASTAMVWAFKVILSAIADAPATVRVAVFKSPMTSVPKPVTFVVSRFRPAEPLSEIAVPLVSDPNVNVPVVCPVMVPPSTI